MPNYKALIFKILQNIKESLAFVISMIFEKNLEMPQFLQ